MRRNSGRIFLIIFIIVGIALFFGGIKLQENIDNFMETAIETVGTVIDVDEEIIRERDTSTGDVTYKTEYNVHVKYKDNNGNEYSKIIETSSNSYYEGDEISLFYNPENPRDSKTQGDTNTGKIMSIFGVGFLIVCVVIIVSDIKQKRRDSQNNIQTTNF